MSKNVFADLGFATDKATEMALRIAVAVEIRRVIEDRSLSTDDAKRLFGVPQPTISKINRLKLKDLSLAFLLRMLFKAGLGFQIASDGSSQGLSVCVEDRPRTAASLLRDWRPIVAATPLPVEVSMPQSNSDETHSENWRFPIETASG